MGLEVLAAALVGLAAVWLVLQPLVLRGREPTPVYEPPDPEETPKGVALAALKEIEFDRETGKLSDEDYAFLKGKYTGVALDALRAESAEAAEVRAQELRTGSEISSFFIANAALENSGTIWSFVKKSRSPLFSFALGSSETSFASFAKSSPFLTRAAISFAFFSFSTTTSGFASCGTLIRMWLARTRSGCWNCSGFSL